MDITKILKDSPKGTKLYSPLFGECELIGIDDKLDYPIRINASNHEERFTKDGKYYIDEKYHDSECVLFQSKENRDWNTFNVKTQCNFKPFDKVLVRNEDNEPWTIQFFGYYDESAKDIAPYICLGNSEFVADTFKQCIPFEGNENLLGHYDNI